MKGTGVRCELDLAYSRMLYKVALGTILVSIVGCTNKNPATGFQHYRDELDRHYWRAVEYERKGEDALAEQEYTYLIDRAPFALRAVLYISRGRARSVIGHYDAALSDYDEVLRMSPSDSGVRFAKASTYAAKEDFATAARILQEYIDLREKECQQPLELARNQLAAYQAIEEERKKGQGNR